jgi:hypothetical protein
MWATAVYSRGGWDMVSKAFSKLPLSSEQILHSDKYFSYEPPVKVTLPEFRSVLGPGWKRIDSDVNGEWGFYLILDEFLNDIAESTRASAGWGGDRFAIYERATLGGVYVAQSSAWDTTADAREFLDAYLKRTWKRFPDAQATDNVSSNERGERHEWRATTGRGVMELRGSRVVIIEGIPAKANVNALLRMVWQQS